MECKFSINRHQNSAIYCVTAILLFIALLITAKSHAAPHQLGDVAPYGNPDGQLNTGDLVVLQKMVLGDLIPTADELQIGDVSPLGAVDGQLNASDLLILQQAILGEITLGSIDLIPSQPDIDAVTSPTSINPYTITGTADPGDNVSVYVDDIPVAPVVADITTGAFSVNVVLSEGDNTVYAIADDGVDSSPQSTSVNINFQYLDGGTLPADVGGMTLLSNTAYIASSDISVNSNVLTIEPGAKIEFDAGVGLKVENINAVLDVQHLAGMPPTIFTSSSATPAAGDWKGIEVGNDAVVTIANAVIEYAIDGIYFNITNGVTAASTITESTIRHNINGFNVYQSADPVITYNQIYSNERGIYVHHNTGHPSYYNGNAYPQVNYNQLYGNTNSIYVSDARDSASANSVHMVIDARNNWWGTAEPADIVNSIYDYRDIIGDVTLESRTPAVDFSGFLDAPDGQPLGEVLLPGISGNVSYNSGDVYLVSDAEVTWDSHLTFNAGVTVKATGSYVLSLKGLNEINSAQLTVQGASQNPVIFTSFNASPAAGDWKGIQLERFASSVIDHAVIEYAEDGLFIDNNSNDVGASMTNTISNSEFRNNNNGLRVYQIGAPNITDSKIQNNEIGVYLHHNAGHPNSRNGKAYPVINNSHISENADWNVFTASMRDSSQPLMIVDLKSNWWGTADPVQISSTIYDAFDNNDYDTTGFRPTVDFDQALDAPAGAPIDIYINKSLSMNTQVDSPIYVFGDLTVQSGVSLDLSAGAELLFYRGSALSVDGNLSVAGTVDRPVLFVPVELTSDRDYWNGITIKGPATNIDNCYITNAKEAFRVEGADGSISNCVIKYNETGIYVFLDVALSISNNVIVENDTGLYFNGISAASNLQVSNNDIYSNSVYNIYFRNVSAVGAINFDNNWWNETDLQLIQDTFYYFSTNPAMLNNIASSPNHGVGLSSVSISHNYISPAVSAGVQDDATISAALASSASWEIVIRDTAGQLVYSHVGSGSTINHAWAGINNSSASLPDGSYVLYVKNNSKIVHVAHMAIDNVLPLAAIDSALQNLTVTQSSLPINGVANDFNIAEYRIEIADGWSPSPGDYRNIYVANKNINNGLLVDWLINNGANNQEVAGDKTLQLTVIDKAGNPAVATVQITLDYPSISNVSYSPARFSPANGETMTVDFYLGKPATVELRIYDEKKYKLGDSLANVVAELTTLGDTLYRTESQTYTAAGSYSLPWDGKDEFGNIVPQEAYRFELFVDDGVSTNRYFVPIGVPANLLPDDTDLALVDPSLATVSTVNAVSGESYLKSDWTKNDNIKLSVNVPSGNLVRIFTTVSYSLSTASEAMVSIDKVLEEGDHVLMWDGRAASEKLALTGVTIRDEKYIQKLAPNTVFVRNPVPELKGIYASPHIEIKSNPHKVLHSYDQISEIQYTVSEDSDVTVKILPPCAATNDTCTADPAQPAAITLVDNEAQDALDGLGSPEVHSFTWHGYDETLVSPDTNNIRVEQEGVYTFYIEATSHTTGNTATYRGALNLHH